MFQNYLKIAYRNLIRHKGFSFLNIAGLALGLTACLLISLFVYDELQYDKFLLNGERVYRVYTEQTAGEVPESMASVPPMFATTMQQEFPEVEQSVRLLMYSSISLFEVGDKKLYIEDGIIADSTFFDVFPLPFRYGSAAQALDAPSSIVLAEDVAKRFFGDENPLGKEIKMNKQTLVVKGVLQNNQVKFHRKVNYVIPLSIAKIPAKRMSSWGWQQFYTYVRLKPGTDSKQTQAKLQAYLTQKVQPLLPKDDQITFVPYLQPLHDIYLHSASFKFDTGPRGNITYVKALSIIAVFILLIACFNFVNLATAKSVQRAKEVGIRKTIGASQRQLMLQFLIETVLLTFISVLIAVALTSLLLPALNEFTGKELRFNLLANPVVLLLLLVLTVVVGVVAGFYPALVLSGFKPVKVLKSAVVSEGMFGRVQWLRHGLIVIQFSLTIFLLISATVVFLQVNYLHTKDLGFNREQIMFFPMRGENMEKSYETFKNELAQGPGIAAVSIGYGFPGDAVAGDQIMVPRNGEKKSYSVTQLMVDYDYLKTLGLELLVGRNFSKELTTDKDHAFILNETAVKDLGFGTPEKAMGQTLIWGLDPAKPDSVKKGQVIGVVKDFHYKSLYDKVEPAVLHIYPEANWKVAVKMKPDNISQSVAHVKTVWSRFSPDYPIEYKFMDENFDQMYKAEDKLKSLLWIFTGMAIFVGCLGLFGLATYAAERRKKEIGIRKVLGANVSTIVALLSKEFIKLVVVAAIIAFPIAWLVMRKWLEDFAYRIDIPLWVFMAAGVAATLVAFLTISYQAIKAATTNPINNLRTE